MLSLPVLPEPLDAGGRQPSAQPWGHERSLAAPKVLFLDFDGVLHPLGLTLDPVRTVRGKPVARAAQVSYFCWNAELERLLEGSSVHVVVHSMWRKSRGALALKQCLGPLAHRFAGQTCAKLNKDDSIQQWLVEQGMPVDFRILDDTPTSFVSPALVGRLIRCHSQLGVTEESVSRAVAQWVR